MVNPLFDMDRTLAFVNRQSIMHFVKPR
jgi:hypothetical protein